MSLNQLGKRLDLTHLGTRLALTQLRTNNKNGSDTFWARLGLKQMWVCKYNGGR